MATSSRRAPRTDWRAALRRPPWRTLAPTLALVALCGLAYALWSPGEPDPGPSEFTGAHCDGRHSRARNAIWLQHGWLGDDAWFSTNGGLERREQFREPERIAALASRLRDGCITDVFPHLCPAGEDGRVASHDAAQVERFLDALGPPFRVLPWVGGARDGTARIEDRAWRAAFVASARELLERHPRLAGVHVNIEPCPDGDPSFLALLDELRGALPAGKLLSVAAYPPPTVWHRFPDVHWGERYFGEVTRRSDQVAVMAYDTALVQQKVYRWLVSAWTREVLTWSRGADVLIGVPTYEDAGSGWHDPEVESLRNALLGVHAALGGRDALPERYQGLAIYCEWETDDEEWWLWRQQFAAPFPLKGHPAATLTLYLLGVLAPSLAFAVLGLRDARGAGRRVAARWALAVVVGGVGGAIVLRALGDNRWLQGLWLGGPFVAAGLVVLLGCALSARRRGG